MSRSGEYPAIMSALTVVPNQPDRLSEQVAAEVRAYMARGRINQTQLAEALGLTQSSISKRLRGVIAFDMNELQQVAQTLGVHPAVLLGGSAPSPSGGNTLRSLRKSDTLRNARRARLDIVCNGRSGELRSGGIAA